MTLKKFALTAITTAAMVGLPALTSSARAAVLGGSSACSNVSFSYLNCAGAFAGNDKGANGTGLTNLDNLFGSGWSFAGDNEDGLVSFSGDGLGAKSGTASTSLSGAGAIAVKAGNSYSLYTVADLASFDWGTAGVTPVGKGNTPGLSHLSVYRRANDPETPATKEVPEPSLLLGMIGLVSIGTRLRRS